MKKLIVLLFVAFTCVTTWADVVVNSTTFPDANFRNFVITKVAGGSDGKFTNAELAKITSMGANNLGINDVTGIEHFTSLKRLGLYNNNIKKLDLSANKNLTYLDCHDNQLTDLDVSKHTMLDTLSIANNKISSIDITNNTRLLRFLANDNPIQSIDISKNTKLKTLFLCNNNLSEINLENNVELKQLSIYYNSIRELDLSKLTKLEVVEIQGNLLTKLDLSNTSSVTRLWCHRNNLTELNLGANNKITELKFYNNQLYQLIEPAGSTTTWQGDSNVDKVNFSGEQSLVMTADLVNINGDYKYVITMPEDFVANNLETYKGVPYTVMNNLNGKNGVYLVIDPNNKPQAIYYLYKFNPSTKFTVSININYSKPYGDVNGDGIVDVDDVSAVINKILM